MLKKRGSCIYVCVGNCIMLKKTGSFICLWGSLHNAEKPGVLYMSVGVIA